MPKIPVFASVGFWGVLLLCAFLYAALLYSSRIPIKVRLVILGISQLAILSLGLKIPLLAILSAFIILALFYAGATRNRSKTFHAALWGFLFVFIFFRQAIFLDVLPSFINSYLWPYFLVGLGYALLRAWSFSVDLRAGKIVDPSFLIFILYMMFVPSLVAGPITRYEAMKNDLINPEKLTADGGVDCILRLLSGIAKKVLIAKFLAPHSISAVSSLTVGEFSPAQLWLGLYVYSAVLYLDFSAYTDFSIATAFLFGVKLPENFNWPYLRKNIVDFWNSWHMSLSHWLRDYIFMPSGQWMFRLRNIQLGPWQVGAIAYLLTMGFCGIWHGWEWHYLWWGIYHGIGLSIYKGYRMKLMAWPSPVRQMINSKLFDRVSPVLTFHFVLIGWLLFIFDITTLKLVAAQMLGGK